MIRRIFSFTNQTLWIPPQLRLRARPLHTGTARAHNSPLRAHLLQLDGAVSRLARGEPRPVRGSPRDRRERGQGSRPRTVRRQGEGRVQRAQQGTQGLQLRFWRSIEKIISWRRRRRWGAEEEGGCCCGRGRRAGLEWGWVGKGGYRLAVEEVVVVCYVGYVVQVCPFGGVV